MIIDSHCHAWAFFPYQPPVPDPETRGSFEQLRYEMDSHGVDRALIVCAEIEHNPDNNQYVYEKTFEQRDRFAFVIDVDSFWTSTYHRPGAVERLAVGIARWRPAGFTHYIADPAEDAAWLTSSDGMALFELAQTEGILASIHCRPQHQKHIRALAKRFPRLTILMHHMGHPKALEPEGLSDILATARQDNVTVKVSGFYNSTTMPPWDYPLSDVQPIVNALYQRFGGSRLLWGSDYPVCRGYFSYRHAIEIMRRHCDFIPPADMDAVMGGNLAALLGA
ncbi:MAG: amidohydrolase family protein [Chloroflexi bacterium]|nr:amidohydrolase family protein [Chloroflexota bacterium]